MQVGTLEGPRRNRVMRVVTRRPIRSMLCALGLALLAACASTPRKSSSLAFDDAGFAPPSERIDPGAVFELSPAMLAYIDPHITPEQKSKGRQRGLLFGLFASDRPFLAYEATWTRTASEAFDARSGNCLSLVLMTGAFAHQLGLDVRYQWIHTWKSWSRGDSLDYVNTHVNLVLLPPNEPHADGVLVDFLPPEANTVQHTDVVEEKTIVSMYLNNRAVELLAQGEIDRAYWWAKAAIAQDPGFYDAVNTLAVIYKARGRLASAERALDWLLEREPDNIAALENLQRVLDAQGRTAEAEAVAKRVAELMPVAPFHYYELGQQALQQGHFQDAKQLFQKELRRDSHYDKFHASLALAHYALGEMSKAQTQMAIALENSTTTSDRAMYARMLQRLRAGEHP
jgi:Tfp pilus assembly protein PilF